MLGYELKNEHEESVFQFASGKDVFVCLPMVMASHSAMESCIKYGICGRIHRIPLQRKAVWRETRPFHPRAGDVIHPVLWLVKGHAIAKLELSDLEEMTTGQSTNQESLMVAICGMGKSCQSALDGVTSEWTSWQRLSTGHRLNRQRPLGRPIGSAR